RAHQAGRDANRTEETTAPKKRQPFPGPLLWGFPWLEGGSQEEGSDRGITVLPGVYEHPGRGRDENELTPRIRIFIRHDGGAPSGYLAFSDTSSTTGNRLRCVVPTHADAYNAYNALLGRVP
ncbi:hypothetical protein PV377_27125, partial [Streptomyces ipomoeae]|nr:hypothetical protein [Streptomyces ipomoeae]MDX2842586.1 hypothetical protein [Streptomyces ipomoeae]